MKEQIEILYSAETLYQGIVTKPAKRLLGIAANSSAQFAMLLAAVIEVCVNCAKILAIYNGRKYEMLNL